MTINHWYTRGVLLLRLKTSEFDVNEWKIHTAAVLKTRTRAQTTKQTRYTFYSSNDTDQHRHTIHNSTDSHFTKQQDWFSLTHTRARACNYRDSIQRIIRSARFVNKSSAVNETHPVSANTKYTVRDSVVRHTSSTLSRAASLASLRLRVSGIRILRVDSPLRFFIDLIVSVFQWVRASPSARRENARTLPNPSAGSPDPSALSLSLTHYCCVSSHSRHALSLYRTIVR